YDVAEGDQHLVVMRWGTEPPHYDDPRSEEDGPWRSIDAEDDGIDDEKDDDGDDDEAKGDDDSSDGEKEKHPLVVSGGMTGESELQGKPALFDIPVGKGRVIAFTFDPIHRLMSRSDFRIAWNALLNWNDLPEPTPEGAGR
ncbi:MAG: hypothetical protein V3U83_09570, partial [Acidobacteriota bacterium]